MTVDDYVRANVLPEHREIVKKLRQIMRELAPEAEETISYNMPVWKGRKIFAWFTPNKKGITFSFTYGTRFEDRYGLLKGTAKVSRYLKFKSADDVDKKVIAYYVKQAVALDAA